MKDFSSHDLEFPRSPGHVLSTYVYPTVEIRPSHPTRFGARFGDSVPQRQDIFYVCEKTLTSVKEWLEGTVGREDLHHLLTHDPHMN